MSLKQTLTKKSLAEFLGVSTRTLDRWHTQRIGPARSKIGNFITYRMDAIEDWLQKNEVKPVKFQGGK